MQLQREQPLCAASLSITIDNLSRLHPINVMGQIEITCDDPVAVPVFLFNRLGNVGVLGKIFDFFLQLAVVTNCEDGLFATKRKNAAKTFAVADTGEGVARLKVGLIATDAPLVGAIGLETTVLDAAVAADDLVVET